MIVQMTAPLGLQGECWPTRSQTWLLRAALLFGPPALQAWQVWKKHAGDLDHLDEGSRRLLPLLFSNLRANHVSDPLMVPLKATYRQTWYRNQNSFHQIAGLLAALQAAGLPTLILKGAALAVLHYRDLGLRPMVDFDILVPTAQIAPAFAELERLGWHCVSPIADLAQLTGVRHALNFVSADRRHFDLHWHVFWEGCYPGADDVFWAGAVPTHVNHVATQALNPTDQLLHVCVHGASFNLLPPVRWAADAAQILRTSAAAIDWQRLVELATRLRLSLPLHDTLYFLQTALEAPIPPEVIEALAAVPVVAADREFYRLKISRRALLGDLPVLWQHYRLIARATHQPSTPLGFSRYLRQVFALERLGQVPGFVLNKAARRVRAVAGRSRQAEPDTESVAG